MKHVLYILLICICTTSSIANGRKYVLKNAPVEAVEAEGDDCDDKHPPLFDSLDPLLYFSYDFRFPGRNVNAQFTQVSDFVSSIELDYFCPPPNLLCPDFTTR